MKTLKVNKPYSWLQWPTVLSGIKYQTHVTAKFFGRVGIDPAGVKMAIDRVYSAESYSSEYLQGLTNWKPELFGELIYVLELVECPPFLKKTHEQFAFLKDEFEPWRPHITVPREYWEKIKNSNGRMTPKTENLRFGELELFLGDPDLETE